MDGDVSKQRWDGTGRSADIRLCRLSGFLSRRQWLSCWGWEGQTGIESASPQTTSTSIICPYIHTTHIRHTRPDLPSDTLKHARCVDRGAGIISVLDQCACGACDRCLEACQVVL